MTACDVPPTRPVEGWSATIDAAGQLGDHLGAIDLATCGLQEHPESLQLEYKRLLAFANIGANHEAERRLHALRQSCRLDSIADSALRIDFATLAARLLKDRAKYAAPAERALLAARAAEAYEDVYHQSGESYPAINAATLWRVAGDADRAAKMAHATLASAAGEYDPYWTPATAAEARMLLGDEPGAAAALRAAVAAGTRRLSDIASTRRQLTWLAGVIGLGSEMLAAMPAPRVVHWIADPLADPDAVARFPADIQEWARDGPGLLAYGSVFSPADVAVGEALLRQGAELQLVLPCAADVCRELMARRDGSAAERFDRLLGAARTVSEVTLEGDPEEITVQRLALIQARGQAMLHGAYLSVAVRVLLCMPGRAELQERSSGTADLDRLLAGWAHRCRDDSVWSGRQARALVFGDVKGFSRISEAQHATFLRVVIGGFADALASLGGVVEYAETAGDGLYVVLSDVAAAVRACHALHRVAARARLLAAGLPGDLGLRLSAHVGPVFRGLDRVIGRERFFGKEVIRTARIEPITPPGETYVTEQFAAALCCVTGGIYECQYVGRQPMAKGFGECRMYSLREIRGQQSPQMSEAGIDSS
jgi:hypothetical protein